MFITVCSFGYCYYFLEKKCNDRLLDNENEILYKQIISLTNCFINVLTK